MLTELLLEADARRRGRILAPAVDLGKASPTIEGERLVLIDARLEYQAANTERLGGGLEAGQHGRSDSPASMIRFDVHPLCLGGRRVEKTDRATPYRPAVVAGDEKDALAAFQMFGFEVRPEALLGRVKLGQARVQRRDQSPCIIGVKRLHGDRQGEIGHVLL